MRYIFTKYYNTTGMFLMKEYFPQKNCMAEFKEHL